MGTCKDFTQLPPFHRPSSLSPLHPGKPVGEEKSHLPTPALPICLPPWSSTHILVCPNFSWLWVPAAFPPVTYPSVLFPTTLQEAVMEGMVGAPALTFLPPACTTTAYVAWQQLPPPHMAWDRWMLPSWQRHVVYANADNASLFGRILKCPPYL